MANFTEKLGKLSLAILENFVESKLGTKFVDELRAPTDRALAIAKALEETEKLCTTEFEDKSLAKALFVDLKQADRPVLKEAVGKYFDHPTDPNLRNSLRAIFFDEFKNVLSQAQINKAVNDYVFILTKELMLADAEFRNNIAGLATYEGNLAEKQSLEELKKINENLAGWVVQQQNIPTKDVHPTIGFIPAPKVAIYIDRGDIEDEVIEFLLKGGKGAILGVHAPGGLGKTELAKKTAKKLGSQYEILWIDVGEKKPEQVIGEILIKCGVQTQPNTSYESLKNELQYLYQQKRFLIIFDDVRKDALEALDDFLPPSPNSALVTSRVQQIGGVKNFELKAMTWEQAESLFRAILEDGSVNAELETLKQLAERCKFNPLAMEIAARRILQWGGMRKPVAKYFEIAQTKLAELKMEGDARWDMHAIFEISYLDLSEDDREKFETLAVFHPTGFSIQAVAYLWGLEISLARGILTRFINLSLVKIVDTEDETLERYRLHDLLDEYASLKLDEKAEKDKFYELHANSLISLFEEKYTDDLSSAPEVAFELDNLRYAISWAIKTTNGEILALLVTKPRNWFYNVFRVNQEWEAWLQTSLRFDIEDNHLKANVLQAIGDVQQFRDDRDAALESYNEALTLFKAVGDKLGEANVLQAIGDVQQFRDDRDAALESYNEALTLFKAVGAKLGEANILQALIRVELLESKNILKAEENLEKTIQLRRSIGDVFSEGADYFNFAVTLTTMRNWDIAHRYCLKSREVLDRISEESPVLMTIRLEKGIGLLKQVIQILPENKSEALTILQATKEMLYPTGELPLFAMLDELEMQCK